MQDERKTILITAEDLSISGISSSLLSMLDVIDHTKYKIFLFLQNHMVGKIDGIPKHVILLPPHMEYCCLRQSPLYAFRKSCYKIGLAIFKAQLKSFWLCGKRKNDYSVYSWIAHFTTPLLPQIAPDHIFDIAISFLAPHNIVSKKVNARKKVAWVHTDYSSITVATTLESHVWQGFDAIACVSLGVERLFHKVFPCTKEKTIVIKNIVDPERVVRLAKEQCVPEMKKKQESSIAICSVGQLTYAKGFANAVLLAKALKDEGCVFTWFIVGNGPEEANIRKVIAKNHMNDYFILLGQRNNPYPYIRACDIYIQSSKFEGHCIAVTEAQILEKPVILTDFPTAAWHLEKVSKGSVISSSPAEGGRQLALLLAIPNNLCTTKYNIEQLIADSNEKVNILHTFLTSLLTDD